MSLTKKILIALVVLALLLAAGAYFGLRAAGVISRADYDHEPPAIPNFARPAILVLSKANGFVHVDALPAGEAMLRQIAEAEDWDIYTTDNAASHNPGDLAKFSVVVWNNTSGDILTTEQRAALKAWVEQGGGWVGLHAAGGDLRYSWDWYVDTLVGAQFVGHTSDPQFQDADVHVADPEVAVTAHLDSPWVVPNEEWYAFDSNPRDKGYEILLTLDEDSYITMDDKFMWRERMEGEHPIAWRHQLGQGRALYSAIGHQGATYNIPEFRQLVTEALRWAGAREAMPAQ